MASGALGSVPAAVTDLEGRYPGLRKGSLWQ